jgi:DUF2075 family protein
MHCWFGTISDFLSISLTHWLSTLKTNYQQLYRQRSTATQNQAWQDCGEVLRSQLATLIQSRPESATWTLIFEYELPGEGGRRPDLVILGAGHILVFEFKQKKSVTIADLDQVAAYARDITEYHSASANHPVTAILVPTQYEKENNEKVINPKQISNYLETLKEIQPEINANDWVNADYEPLPTIIQAARRIFQQEPLPSIKRAQSAGIPALLDYLNRLIEQAQAQQEKHLVLITGVPGTGKTLVGLQFVYQNSLQEEGKKNAAFLSGNAPLIGVLQYALQSRAFVREVRNFYIQHEARRQSAPKEHIIVFDEAQRAWDSDRMSAKYGIDSSAPGAVIRICDRIPNWCVLVGLIGEGQQIHVGEEDGIEQWNLGLEQVSDWHLHCAPEQAQSFTCDSIYKSNLFNLTTSLRTHLAKHVQTWVSHVLLGKFEQAAELMLSLVQEGFDTYLTQDIELAKNYCRDRYPTQLEKRYGLLASSRARNLTQYGINNDYLATKKLKVGAWYIDPVDSPLSCCALEDVATEFSCQGLELDFPIVAWGNDLIWRTCEEIPLANWSTSTKQKNVRDPLRLRLNSYRVLLTRGRDGFIIFVPPESRMNSTFEALKMSGLRILA